MSMFRIGKYRRCSSALSWLVFASMLILASRFSLADDAKQAMFERVFGDAARLDPELVAKTKALPAGEKLMIDSDGDGRHDEVWMLDTASRHTKSPLLVRVIDEDGDLDKSGGPDLDSDLYLADWGADGVVDVAIDYLDEDGDNDLDAMGTFYWIAKDRRLGKPALRVWWGADECDDNLLWYNVDWTYSQRLCQYRSNFSGGTWFSAYNLTADSDRWIALWENPFVFLDPDDDGSAEVVVRFTGLSDDVECLRYSFDADADAYGARPYDYEFSITALAGGSPLKLPHEMTHSFEIRGLPTDRVLRWDVAQKFADNSPWTKACLTWDEMNANTEHRVDHDPHERWEGVIAHKSENFPQIGGPPCGKLNKRNEIVENPASPLVLYHDATDHRLHLLGTGRAEGWLDVDFDLDGRTDARYTYIDADENGIFDHRRIDLDADGTAEFDWKMQTGDVCRVELEYESLSAFYRRELAAVLEASQQFVDAADAALGDRVDTQDPVRTFFLTKLSAWQPSTRLGARMRSTPGGARHYVDLVRDRLLLKLRQEFGGRPAWRRVEAAYSSGDFAAAAELVLGELVPDAAAVSPLAFEGFTRRIPIRIDNSGGLPQDNFPVALDLAAIRSAVSDFNPDNCAVVAPQRWLDWREVPHQVDRFEGRVSELCFLADLPADSPATYFLYYSPAGKRDQEFPRRTRTDEVWSPAKANIGWESAAGAYRTYYGTYDFFGKNQYADGRKKEWWIYPITGRVSFHSEVDWGIDALLLGKTSGLGGLTIYEGDKAWLVHNPAGKGDVKFTQRILTAGPVRALVEVIAENIIPNRPEVVVRSLCIIYAEHQESEIRVAVDGLDSSVLLAPGMVRLAREEVFLHRSSGCLGSWGWQDDVIGEIGIGLIFPPDRLKDVVKAADEQRLLLEPDDGQLRYWIIGDWRRGRPFPVAPTIDNWQKELTSLSGRLQGKVSIAVGSGEELP
jgi:uncharacterized protein DUF4861